MFNITAGKDIINSLNESSYEVETSDTLTSIAISKNGRYLLANVSLT